MAVVRNLIPKRLTLIRYTYKTKSGGGFAYRARIWQPILKKSAEITLKSKDEQNASAEAFEVYAKHANDVEKGRDIGSRRKKLSVYVETFLEHEEGRAQLKQITHKRVEVVRHNLKSLSKFSELHKNPSLDQLSSLYDAKFILWRSKQKAQITGKPLSNRYLNSELSAHRQFFNWAVKQNYCVRPLQTSDLKTERANLPFPQKHYQKLLSVARKEIEKTKNVRIKWNLMTYRTLLMLMNSIGCRVVETKNMKWSDLVSSKKGTELKISGKGKERVIQIPDRVAGHLLDLKKFKETYGKSFGWDESIYPFIFSGWKSEKPTKQYDAGIRRRWMKEAGVEKPEDWELVCFRHKFITDTLNNGVHSLAVANYTGTSQQMIEKTYSGLVAGDIYNLVFKNASNESLSRNEPKWLEKLLTERD